MFVFEYIEIIDWLVVINWLLVYKYKKLRMVGLINYVSNFIKRNNFGNLICKF